MKQHDEFTLRRRMLEQFGRFMWDVQGEADRDFAIGFNEEGMPNSVSLEIHGRTHSEFTYYD